MAYEHPAAAEFRATADTIEAEPRRYDQGAYARWIEGPWPDRDLEPEQLCNTACCIAGHVALADGWTPAGWIDPAGGAGGEWVKDGRYGSVEDIAADILELDREEASHLFHGQWIPAFLAGVRPPQEQLATEVARQLRRIADGEITVLEA